MKSFKELETLILENTLEIFECNNSKLVGSRRSYVPMKAVIDLLTAIQQRDKMIKGTVITLRKIIDEEGKV